jgi:alanine racemase
MANVQGELEARRFTRAEVDLGALRSNVQVLTAHAGTSELWAVVKANAYGHGAVACAKAALSAGARGLCVALTQEALELRAASIDAPLMVLSEQPSTDVPLLVRNDVICVVYNQPFVDALAAESQRQSKRTRVHLKIDTGMHRVGVAPEHAAARAKHIVSSPHLVLHGVMTHLATADEPQHAATSRQLDDFRRSISDVRAIAPEIEHVHAANSSAALRSLMPECTMVRAGIAMYGLTPGAGVADHMHGLRPVMSLRTRVSHVRRVRAGEGVSYGLRTTLNTDTTVATLPLGYADGVPRRAWETSARILVGGHRRRILGVVTMDQLMVDCGNDDVSVGDEAVIFGSQAGETVSVEDWATALGTITYEVVCAVSARVPRDFVGV